MGANLFSSKAENKQIRRRIIPRINSVPIASHMQIFSFKFIETNIPPQPQIADQPIPRNHSQANGPNQRAIHIEILGLAHGCIQFHSRDFPKQRIGQHIRQYRIALFRRLHIKRIFWDGLSTEKQTQSALNGKRTSQPDRSHPPQCTVQRLRLFP